MNFENKNIIVIGGSSGIGRGIASSYIEKGANVCITGTRDKINAVSYTHLTLPTKRIV